MDEPLDYEKNKISLLLESAKCNTSHGDRLNPNDKKRVDRDIASTDSKCKYTEDVLAEKLGVTQQTIDIWISDIRAWQRTNRNSIIIRLSRLGPAATSRLIISMAVVKRVLRNSEKIRCNESMFLHVP
jgi:hypothetical protein